MHKAMAAMAIGITVLAMNAAAQTVTGSGTSNTVPVFTGTSTLGNSPISVSGGNVGVGTTSPNATLDINTGTAGASLPGLFIHGSDNHAIRMFSSLGAVNYNNIVQLGDQGIIYSGGSGNGAFVIAPYAGATSGLRMDGSGKMGIGTTSPISTLTVLSSGSANNIENQLSGFQILSGTNVGTDYTMFMGVDPTNHLSYIQSVQWGTQVAPLTLNARGGNVGIGTTNPQYKLSVNGTIQAKEVLVNTGWADYVFQPDYRVTPLTEVAAFIKANHHLPNIPSESEVKESGVNLGDMQAKLLAKIEELTLQMIQLDEKNRKLEKSVKQIQVSRISTSKKNGGK